MEENQTATVFVTEPTPQAGLVTPVWSSLDRAEVVCYSILLVIIVVGNSLTMMAILRCRWLHTRNNILVFSLALADGMMCLPCTQQAYHKNLSGRLCWEADCRAGCRWSGYGCYLHGCVPSRPHRHRPVPRRRVPHEVPQPRH